jgi:hypothetical protein
METCCFCHHYYPEDGISRFLWHVDMCQWNCTVSYLLLVADLMTWHTAAASSMKALFYVTTVACHWLSGRLQEFYIQWWPCLSVVTCTCKLKEIISSVLQAFRFSWLCGCGVPSSGMWGRVTELFVPDLIRPLSCLNTLEMKYSDRQYYIPEEGIRHFQNLLKYGEQNTNNNSWLCSGFGGMFDYILKSVQYFCIALIIRILHPFVWNLTNLHHFIIYALSFSL